MAWPVGRLWRVCMVGVGVGCAYAWRWRMVCYGVCMALGRRWCSVCMACVGTVYGVQALGVRMVYVVYVSFGVRCVYVVYIVL